MDWPVHPVDIVAAAYAVYALIRGIKRGLASELVRLCGGVAIVVAAWWLTPLVAEHLVAHTRLETEGTAAVLAFSLLLVLGYVVLLSLRLLLKALLDFKFKGPLERAGGGVAGALRATLVMIAVMFVVYFTSSGYLYEHILERPYVGQAFTNVIGPSYENLAATHPALRLPIRKLEADPRPASTEELPLRDDTVDQERP